jgi:hypothetical protein
MNFVRKMRASHITKLRYYRQKNAEWLFILLFCFSDWSLVVVMPEGGSDSLQRQHVYTLLIPVSTEASRV